jgi:hypothetical protein
MRVLKLIDYVVSGLGAACTVAVGVVQLLSSIRLDVRTFVSWTLLGVIAGCVISGGLAHYFAAKMERNARRVATGDPLIAVATTSQHVTTVDHTPRMLDAHAKAGRVSGIDFEFLPRNPFIHDWRIAYYDAGANPRFSSPGEARGLEACQW